MLLGLLIMQPVYACFGPKLFFATGDKPEEKLLYALITLYVKEKTGVESTPVAVVAGQNPVSLLADDKADLVLTEAETPPDGTIFRLAGYPLLVAGKRPFDDLQFTTVVPAIEKLNRLIKSEDMQLLLGKVKAGESAMFIVREFFMERRLI